MDKQRVVPGRNLLPLEAIAAIETIDEKKFLLHVNYIIGET